MDIAIVCETCFGNGSFGTMRPGGDHDDDPAWAWPRCRRHSGEWVIT